LQTGIVLKSTGSWYDVQLEDGRILPSRIVGKIRLDDLKLTNPVAVGDHVQVRLDTDQDEETGSIVKAMPRRNYVVRQSPRQKHYLHMIASNIDQAVLVVTIIAPKLKPAFIDRFLLMTEPHDIPAIIVFNKADLYEDEDFGFYQALEEIYEKIGYKCLLVSATNGPGVAELKALMKDKVTLFSGQSGVGKSTLINAIQPDLELRTEELSDYSGKGQHTTTFAEMHPLDMGGFLIDTPGIKSLSFNNLEVMDVAHNYREFFELSDQCKFANCTHRNEPKCAVKAAIEEGEVSELRYINYLQILDDIEQQNYWERHRDV